MDEKKRQISSEEGVEETKLQKIWRVSKTMTIEPALLVHMVASFMGNLFLQNLMIERTCLVSLNYTEDICYRLKEKINVQQLKDEETNVQKVIADMNTWRQALDNTFPVFIVIFLGAWSDIYGRKLPFLLSIFGYILRYGGLVLASYYEDWTVQIIALIATLPISLTGSRTEISLSTYSYIADTTSMRDRTMRTGILAGIRTFGKSLGSLVGGEMLGTNLSFMQLFAIGGGLECFAFILAFVTMKNTRKNMATKEQNAKSTWETYKDIFNFRNVLDAAKTCIKKRPHNNRIILYLLIVCVLCTMAPIQGEESIFYLFTRKVLDWNASNFGRFNTFKMLISFFGNIFAMGFLSYTLQLTDSFIGILSCISQTVSSFIYAFAVNNLMFYLAPVVDILNGSMLVAARSMISKIIPMEEIGKVNSFIAVLESLMPLPVNPFYSKVYRWTLDNFIGAIFILSIIFTIPPFIIFTWLWVKKLPKNIFSKFQKMEEKSSEVSSRSSTTDEAVDDIEIETEKKDEEALEKY